MNEAWLWTLFKQFDVDDTNYISHENLIEAFKHFEVKITDQEIQEIFEWHDHAKDKQLSFEEFKTLMREIT